MTESAGSVAVISSVSVMVVRISYTCQGEGYAMEDCNLGCIITRYVRYAFEEHNLTLYQSMLIG